MKRINDFFEMDGSDRRVAVRGHFHRDVGSETATGGDDRGRGGQRDCHRDVFRLLPRGSRATREGTLAPICFVQELGNGGLHMTM